MPVLRFASPLSWPEGVPSTPRNRQRADHGFAAMTLAESIGYLDQEVQELQVANAVLSLDIDQPLLERLRKKVGSRTGACVHFKYNNRGYVLACDTWLGVEHNIYAMHLTLRQLHNIERWGVGSIAVLLSGFEADRLPEFGDDQGQRSMEPWMEALGLGPTATLEDAIAVYHRRAKLVADDTELLTKLNLLMDEVRSHFAGRHEP